MEAGPLSVPNLFWVEHAITLRLHGEVAQGPGRGDFQDQWDFRTISYIWKSSINWDTLDNHQTEFLFLFLLLFPWQKEGFCYKALGDGQGEEASRGAMSPTWPKKQFLNLCEKHNYKRRCNQCSTVWVHQGHDSFEMLPGGNVNARQDSMAQRRNDAPIFEHPLGDFQSYLSDWGREAE